MNAALNFTRWAERVSASVGYRPHRNRLFPLFNAGRTDRQASAAIMMQDRQAYAGRYAGDVAA